MNNLMIQFLFIALSIANSNMSPAQKQEAIIRAHKILTPVNQEIKVHPVHTIDDIKSVPTIVPVPDPVQQEIQNRTKKGSSSASA